MGDSKKKSLKIPKGVIRIRKSKKDRQHNGQNQKEKGQMDKQQSTKHIHKIKDQVKRTALKYYNLNRQKNTSEHRIKTE